MTTASLALRESTEPVAQQVNGNSLGVGGPLRLNLGGAGEGFLDSHIPGFLTVDLRDTPDTDVVCDCATLDRFESGTVEIVYASNILEHWSLQKTVDVLKEWNRVLKKGGKLYVSVPDFDATVKLYQKTGLTEWINYHLMGDQKHPLNYHYSLFTCASLSKQLLDAGFSDFKRVKFFDDIGVKDGSANLNNVTFEPISLNMVAVK